MPPFSWVQWVEILSKGAPVFSWFITKIFIGHTITIEKYKELFVQCWSIHTLKMFVVLCSWYLIISQGKLYWPWSYWKFAQLIKIVLITNLVMNKSIEWFYRNTFTPMWLKVTLLIRFSVQILYRMRGKCMQIPSWKGWAKCSLGSYLRPLGLYGCLQCRVCWVNQVYGY